MLRSPFNIRPLLGIRPHTSTKGMGYMAWGHLRRFQAAGDPHHAQSARKCLDWLLHHRSPGYSNLCWGNEFTFTTRAGRIPQREPTIVWSGLIGQAFVDAFEILGDPRYLEAANSTCDWILKLAARTESPERASAMSLSSRYRYITRTCWGARCWRVSAYSLGDTGQSKSPGRRCSTAASARTPTGHGSTAGPKVSLDRQLSYGL